MSTGKIITGIVAGAAAGAVLGILFAPNSGAETRRKISQKSTDITDAIKNGFTDLGEAIKNKYENIKGDAVGLMERGKEKVNHIKETAKSNHAV